MSQKQKSNVILACLEGIVFLDYWYLLINITKVGLVRTFSIVAHSFGDIPLSLKCWKYGIVIFLKLFFVTIYNDSLNLLDWRWAKTKFPHAV